MIWYMIDMIWCDVVNDMIYDNLRHGTIYDINDMIRNDTIR